MMNVYVMRRANSGRHLFVFALFILNRDASQSWVCINNAKTQMEACISS